MRRAHGPREESAESLLLGVEMDHRFFGPSPLPAGNYHIVMTRGFAPPAAYPNYPPRGWELARLPCRPTLYGLRMWLDWLLHPSGLLACFEGMNRLKRDPGPILRDTRRLIDYLRQAGEVRTGVTQLIEDAATYTPARARDILRTIWRELFRAEYPDYADTPNHPGVVNSGVPPDGCSDLGHAPHATSDGAGGPDLLVPSPGSPATKEPGNGDGGCSLSSTSNTTGAARSPAVKSKRGTAKGEAREKIIAAITLHHKYENGCLGNSEPVGNNALARAAGGVAQSSVSAFFKKEFGEEQGHAEYKALCVRNPPGLLLWLKKLNGDLPGHELLFGHTPPGEGHRDYDE